MAAVSWEDAPRWVKEAAVTFVTGSGTIDRPIRYEDRNESIALWWDGDNVVVGKRLVREYASDGGD